MADKSIQSSPERSRIARFPTESNAMTEIASSSTVPPATRVIKRAGPRAVRAFSLVELLVVVGLLGLIVAIAVPTYAKIREYAARSREMAAARSLAVAWTSYATDQGGAIIPGFKPGLTAFYEEGTPIPPDAFGGGPTIAARWPWRLAPYTDFNLQSMYVGEQARRLSELENGDPSEYLYFGSLYPSFGMNTTFIGGDSERSGFLPDTLPNGQPNPLGRFYASRLSQLTRPADLIVFASARTQATPDGSMWQGYFRLEPPRFLDRQWAAEYVPDGDSVDDTDPLAAMSFGNLSARVFGGGRDEAITATADGSVKLESVRTLEDMRRWAPGADAWDWDLASASGLVP